MDANTDWNDKEDNEIIGAEGGDIFPLFVTPKKFQPKAKRTPKRKFTEEPGSVSVCNKGRPRTPSGQILSTTVNQIKSALALDEQSLFKAPNYDHAQPISLSGKHQTVKFAQSVNQHVQRDDVNSDQTDNPPTLLSLKNMPNQVQSELQSKEDQSQVLADQSSQNSHKMVQQEMFTINVDRLIEKAMPSENDNPETMDVWTVVKMLQDLQINLRESISADVKHHLDTMCNERNESVKRMEMEIEKLQQRATVSESKERIIVNTMHGMVNKMKEMQQKMEMYEMERAKKMVIFGGLDVSEKRNTARSQITHFFQDAMQIDIQIEDFYFIGQGLNKELVLVLPTISQKKLIFQNISTVKNLVNGRGQKYRFRDFLTNKQNEYRKKCQNIADRAQEETPGTEVATEKGKLYVGNDEYVQRIIPPDPTSVLQLSLERLNQIMSTKIDQGPTFETQGNIFTGYSICTNSFEVVKDAYMKICLNHAGARHIVCAYSLPGRRIAEDKDHCDDEDYGASSPILQMMMENNITHRAIFVVQKCGSKLNQERIPMYLKTAVETVNLHPKNEYTRLMQKATSREKPPVDTYAAAAASPPKDMEVDDANKGKPMKRGYVQRGRGGTRGRGGRGRGRGGRGGFSKQKEKDNIQVYIPVPEKQVEDNRSYRFATPWEARMRQNENIVD